MPLDIQLSQNFWLSELVKSSTATRLGIDNWPKNQKIIDTLKITTNKILQPIRDYYGIPMAPESGYRCLKLNRALKSKDTSKHIFGQAIDIEIPGISNFNLALWIKDNLKFDQLILEFYYPDDPSSGWVHISYVNEFKNRNQILTINKNGIFQSLLTK